VRNDASDANAFDIVFFRLATPDDAGAAGVTSAFMMSVTCKG
jgi:hypothetical protein